MKKYIKKICYVLIFALIFNLIPAFPAKAQNNIDKISSIKDLKKEITKAKEDNKISDEEAVNIKNNLDESVARDYLESRRDDIKKIVNADKGKLKFSVYDSARNISTDTYEYKVDDIITVTITTTTELDYSKNSLLRDTLMSDLNKPVTSGSNHTATSQYVESLFGWVYTKLVLKSNYDVNKSNLTLKYTSTSGSSSAGSLISSSRAVTSKASSKGKSLVSIGDYTVNVGVSTTCLSFKQTIKWYSSDSSGKPNRVYIRHYML